MTIEYMRRYVSDAYPSQKWRDRVRGMRDMQIIATYRRLTKKD